MIGHLASRSFLAALILTSTVSLGTVTQAATEQQASGAETVVSHTDTASKVKGVPLFSSQTKLVSNTAINIQGESSAVNADAVGSGVTPLSMRTTVTTINTFRSLVGITVAKHTGRTWFTWACNTLYDEPKGFTNDWWTVPPTYRSDDSGVWDWFNSGINGDGQSNERVTFSFGVPTPWGPIGSFYTSRIVVWFNGKGQWH
jgi:hypothetical protein